MTTDAQEPGTAVRARARRMDAGKVRLSQRDIDMFLLCAEHSAAPYDLLADAMGLNRNHLNRLMFRWRQSGFVTTARLGPGPLWCWLTKDGMAATGLGYPATRPALARLGHNRAVLAARLWLAGGQLWADSQAWWHSERRLRAARPKNATGHVPDAEIHWPSVDESPYGGQVWAVEAGLTSKTIERTALIMSEMLGSAQYAIVVYLTSPAAQPVVWRAAASLPAASRPKVAVRELPATAFNPAGRR
jgi:hypothetical protein